MTTGPGANVAPDIATLIHTHVRDALASHFSTLSIDATPRGPDPNQLVDNIPLASSGSKRDALPFGNAD